MIFILVKAQHTQSAAILHHRPPEEAWCGQPSRLAAPLLLAPSSSQEEGGGAGDTLRKHLLHWLVELNHLHSAPGVTVMQRGEAPPHDDIIRDSGFLYRTFYFGHKGSEGAEGGEQRRRLRPSQEMTSAGSLIVT